MKGGIETLQISILKLSNSVQPHLSTMSNASYSIDTQVLRVCLAEMLDENGSAATYTPTEVLELIDTAIAHKADCAVKIEAP